MAELNRSTEIPAPSGADKYRGLASILEARIRNGEFRVGAPLPTSLDLAREFGLSKVTVTRAIQVLSRQGLVSTVARRRGAVVLRSTPVVQLNRTTIACLFRPVMTRNEKDNFILDVVQSIHAEISRLRHRLIYHSLDENDYAARVEEVLEHGGACGVLIDQKVPYSTIARLAGKGAPAVLFNRDEDILNLTSVTPDYEAMGRDSARFFIRRGYQRLGLYWKDPDEERRDESMMATWWPLAATRRGFLREAHRQGFRDEDMLMIPQDGFGAPVTEPEAYGIPRSKGRDWKRLGILVSSDVMAVEIIKTIEKTRLKLGRDIGVIGRLDLEYGHSNPVPPSTWGVDRESVGVRAVQELLARVENPRLPPTVVRLPMQFYDRGTA